MPVFHKLQEILEGFSLKMGNYFTRFLKDEKMGIRTRVLIFNKYE